ncbi:MAG: phosphoribosylanthranilate isomerase [Gammaproteobacteria bacterium]|nr:phosphoribosylanthranilate isomerase [Gammaproteobacteria bacterium]MDE0271498.1 phosphoribosylanthranilate isomerase [Gammaproteobacteria bacterium]
MALKIKICGITRVEDLEVLVRLKVDAVGLMFAEESPRRLALADARRLSEQAQGRIARVGVFADAEPAAVRAAIDHVGLDALQFHGQEDAAYCAAFGLPYLKGFKVTGAVDEGALRQRYADACALLLDAGAGGGEPFDWRHWPDQPSGPCILAGGLGPDNVGGAVGLLKPWGVDASSGVEGARKGVKDTVKMKEFVAEARHAAAGE